MSDALATMWRSFDALWSELAGASRGAFRVERPGVRAYVIPVAPERSVFNSITYDDADALAACLPELGERYREAGVRAWTVWTHPGDEEAAAACAAAGHVLDATPEAMALDLGDLTDGPELELPLERPADHVEVTLLNSAAYGDPPGFSPEAAAGLRSPHAHRYLARDGGRAVTTCTVFDHAGDASMCFVATAASHGRRGLGAAIMRIALRDAAARGLGISTLQATRKGRGLYERLGYRSLGTLGMWERREAAAGRAGPPSPAA